MRFSLAAVGLALLELVIGDQHVFKPYSKMSTQEKEEYPAAPGSWIKKLNPADIVLTGIPGPVMSFAVIHLQPGHVREMHWHLESDEWIYIEEGTCEFTLMDSAGRYDFFQADKGSIAFFPRSWSHSFQAINKDHGCTALLWFDKSDVTIEITAVMGELPSPLLRQHLNNIPEDKLDMLRYPFQEVVEGSPGVVEGKIQYKHPGKSKKHKKGRKKSGKKNTKSSNSLVLFPVISVKDGDVGIAADGSGREYRIKQDDFPISKTMSGGVAHLKEGAVRELHWHPASEEHIYVLRGNIKVTVQCIGYENREHVVSTFELETGDIVIFPNGCPHSFEALGGDVIVALMFNVPSWQSISLAESFSVTPKYITAATLDTAKETIEDYFPMSGFGGTFFPPRDM